MTLVKQLFSFLMNRITCKKTCLSKSFRMSKKRSMYAQMTSFRCLRGFLFYTIIMSYCNRKISFYTKNIKLIVTAYQSHCLLKCSTNQTRHQIPNYRKMVLLQMYHHHLLLPSFLPVLLHHQYNYQPA